MAKDCESTLRESRWREQGVKQWAERKTSAPGGKVGNSRFLLRVHFLRQPFDRVSQKITTEFIWLREIDLLWLLSGDMNLSIVVLVFGSKRTKILLVCCLSLDNKLSESKSFLINSMSSRCFSITLIWKLKNLKPGWRQTGARGQSEQEGRQLYCCGTEVDDYDQDSLYSGSDFVMLIFWDL